MARQENDECQKAFTDAIAAGHRAQAEKLWPSCPAPQEFTVRRNPLCEAIRTEQEALALWLIELGFDHRCLDLRGTPAVALCVIADLPEVLKRLLEQGESPHRQVNGHLTTLVPGPPLYEKLRHIRDYPQNRDFEIFHKGSLLHVAAATGSVKCAKVLLEAGVDPQGVDSEGRTPAMLALLGGERTRAVLELLPKPDTTNGAARDELFKLSLLHDDAEGIRNAIAQGADLSQSIESRYSPASTPLIIAACHGNVVILKALLSAGVDINQVDWPPGKKREARGLKSLIEQAGFDSLLSMPIAAGRTALGWAALHGHVKAIKLLIEAGADRNAADLLQFTPLHLAAMGDHPEAVQCLVDLGLNVHAEAFDRMTPLHVAAAADACEAIAVLIRAAADPKRSNRDGETPYVVAKEYGNTAARRKLQPHTPVEFQAKTRKKKGPDWQWNQVKFDSIVDEVRKKYGKAARAMTTEKFRKHLARAATDQTFVETAEALCRKLKSTELGQSDEVPHLRWIDQGPVTDEKLLKLQEQLLSQGVFVVRGLSSRDGTCRVFVLPTTDLFEVCGAFGITGINIGLTPELTIAWLMDLHARHPLRLIGIAHDGVEFRFVEPIEEPQDLVDELMTVCPPEIEGKDSVRKLHDKLKSKTPQVFLWWD
jgi:ankyrin repeat protein